MQAMVRCERSGSESRWTSALYSPGTLWRDRNTTFAWVIPSHDGKRIAIFAQTQSSDAWMVEGF